MKTVDVSEARDQFQALLDRAERGEYIAISRSNLPIAELRPGWYARMRQSDRRFYAVLWTAGAIMIGTNIAIFLAAIFSH